MENFQIDINYTNGSIPFEIKKIYIDENNNPIKETLIEPVDLFFLDKNQFLYYYQLHAFILQNMVQRVCSYETPFEEIQRNHHKISKLTKSFMQFRSILDSYVEENNE